MVKPTHGGQGLAGGRGTWAHHTVCGSAFRRLGAVPRDAPFCVEVSLEAKMWFEGKNLMGL